MILCFERFYRKDAESDQIHECENCGRIFNLDREKEMQVGKIGCPSCGYKVEK